MGYVSLEDLFICDRVFQVAGDGITSNDDASAFLLNLSEPILIDTGAGRSIEKIIENIRVAGVDPHSLKKVVITHNHVDHIGGMSYLKKKYGVMFYLHALDAGAVERGDTETTAAAMYGVALASVAVDVKISDENYPLKIGDHTLFLLHTPGHTPGSISPYIDIEGRRVLFAQDVHGPFLDIFGSDIYEWRNSMERLIELGPDILCEGHFGVFEPGERAISYIRSYLDRYASR